MDIGIVASRYAKALLRFSSNKGEEQSVYAEMQQLHHTYQHLPQLGSALNNPTLSKEQKTNLLRSATQREGNTPSSQSTTRFVELVAQHKRTDLMPFIAASFLRQYEKAKRQTSAHLFLAKPISESTQQRIKALVAERTKNPNVHLTMSIDASLEAGFVLEYDDYRMDASLRGQIERLRRQFKK